MKSLRIAEGLGSAGWRHCETSRLSRSTITRPSESKRSTTTYTPVQAKAAQLHGETRRWNFNEMQNLKKKTVGASVDEEHKPTEIFIMLPLDIIAVGELEEGKETSFIHAPSHNAKLLDRQFATLKEAGAHGVMLDVWWGICERHGPKQYDFGAYMELFKKARKHGLKVQAVMSFHAGGGNVGDGSCDIPLPDWVIKEVDDEIFYTDKRGGRDHECLSLGCDHEPVLAGRTPLQTYADFVGGFAEHCKKNDLWGSTVTEICVGTGPCGELRYPSYQEKDGKWSYFGETLGGMGDLQVQRGLPGIGEFQCYDKFMMESLRQAAEEVNEEEWGDPPREGAGTANSAPWETEFFALTNSGGWLQPYGKFFMEWYSGRLIQHGADILDAVLPVARASNSSDNGSAPTVAGIHWWYKSRSHAAEMTAGYYNHLKRDGYAPIAKMLGKKGVGLSFTCIEMSDDENPDPRHCSPEELVRQVIAAGEGEGLQVLAENALEGGIYNADALNRMLKNSKHFQRITLLRLKPYMFEPDEEGETGMRVKQPLASFLGK
ncbi:glycoside hydrolase, partial [Coccomyxa subellipsoidea C-169]